MRIIVMAKIIVTMFLASMLCMAFNVSSVRAHEVWSVFDDTPEFGVFSLVEYDEMLYAGTGDQGLIYAYDGDECTTHGFGHPHHRIRAMVVYRERLWIALSHVGYFGVSYVYVYDAETHDWELSFTAPSNVQILSMVVYEDEILIGTAFEPAKMYASDGDIWYEFPTPWNYRAVRTLAVYCGKLWAGLYIGGDVWVYDSCTREWSLSLDSHERWIEDLQVYDGKLYAGTATRGLIYVYNKEDGPTRGWQLQHDFIDETILSLEVYDHKLYAGTGDGWYPGDGRIYVYDGEEVPDIWTISYDTPERNIRCFAVCDDKLYAGTDPHGIIYSFQKPEPVVDQEVPGPIDAAMRNIILYSPIGQTFKPSVDTLAYIQVPIGTGGYVTPKPPRYVIRLNVTDETNSEIARQTRSFSATYAEWITFDFPDVPVTPGSTYTIWLEVMKYTTDAMPMWSYSSTDAYLDGTAILSGTPEPLSDQMFRTHGY